AASIASPMETDMQMGALVLLTTLAQTPEAACDDFDMKKMIAAPPSQSALDRQELDRRQALVLLEERAVERAVAPSRYTNTLSLAIPAATVFASAILLLLAVVRRSRRFALAGALGCVLAPTMVALLADRQRRTATRVNELRDCRLRLLDTR